MGANQQKYVKTNQDIVESAIRKTQDIKQFKQNIQGISYDDLLRLNFEPLNWNIIHMLCWYGRADILRDLMSTTRLSKEILNCPDKNKEPPIALACVMDNEEVFATLSQNENVLLNDYDRAIYREYLDLIELSAIHDSINVMKRLYSIFSEELEEDEDIINYLKGVCTKYGSDAVLKFLDERHVESFNMDNYYEKSMNDVASFKNLDQSMSIMKNKKE